MVYVNDSDFLDFVWNVLLNGFLQPIASSVRLFMELLSSDLSRDFFFLFFFFWKLFFCVFWLIRVSWLHRFYELYGVVADGGDVDDVLLRFVLYEKFILNLITSLCRAILWLIVSRSWSAPNICQLLDHDLVDHFVIFGRFCGRVR